MQKGTRAGGFPSSVRPGNNFACFYADAFVLVASSEEVHELTELAYFVKRLRWSGGP